MSLLVVQHPTSPVKRGVQILIFCKKVGTCFGRYDMVLNIRGSYMLSGSLPLIFIESEMTMKHSIGNGCLSLQHSIPFPVIQVRTKSDTVLCETC